MKMHIGKMFGFRTSLTQVFFLAGTSLLFAVPAYGQKIGEIVGPPKKEVAYKPPTIGALALVCNVPTAKVYINDALRGSTTQDKTAAGSSKIQIGNLSKGSYKLKVDAPDYLAYADTVAIAPGQTKIVTAMLKPNFGFVELTLPKLKPNTPLKIEVDGKAIEPTAYQFDGAKLRLRIAPVGPHAVKVAAANRVVFPSKQIDVAPGETPNITAEPPKVDLVIDSVAGARVYADDQLKGSVSESGKLVISDLTPDELHRIRVEAEKYEPYTNDVTLSSEYETVKLPVQLDFINELFVNFDSLRQFQNPPATWSVDNNILTVSGQKTFASTMRGFRGCEVNFRVRTGPTGKAAWTVRTVDDKNYYLFVLDVTNESNPRLWTYVCKDGVINMNNPVKDPDRVLVKQLEKNRYHSIRIKMERNNIQTFIIPAGRPQEDMISVSLFEDRDNNFPFGGIGFATLNGETFNVAELHICPSGANCKPQVK